MCAHNMKKINDVTVCTKCGLTIPGNGAPFFDKELVRQSGRKRRKKT